MLFLYLGPEVLMPLVSAAAAVGGVILMFWRRLLGGLRTVVQLLTGKKKSDGP